MAFDSLARAAAPIRIGVGSDPVFAGFFVAEKEGFFKDEGIEVALQTYSGGGEAMNALVADQVDIASASESTCNHIRSINSPKIVQFQPGDRPLSPPRKLPRAGERPLNPPLS